MLSAYMRLKLTVAQLLVALFHFSYRVASGPYGRVEHPCALGAGPASETLFFNPHHLGVLYEGLTARWRNHFVTVSDTAFVAPKPLRSNGTSRSCVPVRVLRYEGISLAPDRLAA
jgi:hypothetical protein